MGREPVSDAGGKAVFCDGQTTVIADNGDGKFDVHLATARDL